MLVDDRVIHRAQQDEAVEHVRRVLQMLAHLHAGNGRLDRRIRRAGKLLHRVAQPLRIPGVDVRRAAAEPDENAMLGLALGILAALFRGGVK